MSVPRLVKKCSKDCCFNIEHRSYPDCTSIHHYFEGKIKGKVK